MSEPRIYKLELRDGSVVIMQLLTADADPHDQAAQLPYYPDIMYIGEIDRKDIPQDRSFRNAWNHDLKVDMPRAREISRQRLRDKRGAMLSALDVEFMRAVENGAVDAQKSVSARKQVLRDWTKRPELDAADTPEALLKAEAKIASE